MKQLNSNHAALFAALALTACNALDSYEKNWGALRMGDSRQRTVQLLGEPSKVTAIEASIISIEQCVWKVPGGRAYIAHFAMNHLVAKSVID